MEGVSGANKEYSKSSSDDHEPTIGHPNDEAGGGRFYECVFCKRGFPTAQALGGHMNIHRKDRAKNNITQNIINPTASKKGEDITNQSNTVHRLNYHPPISDSLKNYSMLFPAVVPSTSRDISAIRPPGKSHFGEVLQVGLEVNGQEKERKMEGEVDLELRLGN